MNAWRALRRRPGSAAWAAALVPALLLLLLAGESHAQRLAEAQLKNGSAVKRAFRDVVAGARRATVRVRSEGEVIALGTIVDSEGYILTKASELNGDVACQLYDGRRLPAILVGVHDEYDVAMLKVEADGLPVIEWSPGEKDAAVGSLLATAGPGPNPVAVGVLSVARRRIRPARGVLGIVIKDDDDGPRITRVFPGSGAAEAGLKVNDVVTKVAGKVVDSAAALTQRIGSFRPGEELRLLIQRGDEEREIVARLGSELSTFFNRGNLQNRMGGDLSRRRDGFPAVLQHDSVLRPRDCGSVVVDLSGKAVGLNIARAGRIASYAVPASVLPPLIEELKSGRLARPATNQTADKSAPESDPDMATK